MNNHLSPSLTEHKENNHLSPSLTEHKENNHLSPSLTEHKKDMTLKIQVLAWDRHKNVTELNRLMRSQPTLLNN
jgi:hypothetical protein